MHRKEYQDVQAKSGSQSYTMESTAYSCFSVDCTPYSKPLPSLSPSEIELLVSHSTSTVTAVCGITSASCCNLRRKFSSERINLIRKVIKRVLRPQITYCGILYAPSGPIPSHHQREYFLPSK